MPDSGRAFLTTRSTFAEDKGARRDLRATEWCPLDGRGSAAAPGLKADLVRTIEAEIIPRLMLAHRSPGSAGARGGSESTIVIGDGDIAVFAEMIVYRPLSVARAYLDQLRERGLTAEAIITTILSSTARHLGVLWEQDRCSFVDVTVGLSRLQQLLRVYGPDFELGPVPERDKGRMLLAVVPGEQHTFGLAVVEEFFRRAGWQVQSEFLPSRSILLAHVRDSWFDVVGLSASGEVAAAGVSAIVEEVRATALNRNVCIILGGNLFSAHPELARSLGADLGVRDAADAVSQVGHMMDAKKMPC